MGMAEVKWIEERDLKSFDLSIYLAGRAKPSIVVALLMAAHTIFC